MLESVHTVLKRITVGYTRRLSIPHRGICKSPNPNKKVRKYGLRLLSVDLKFCRLPMPKQQTTIINIAGQNRSFLMKFKISYIFVP